MTPSDILPAFKKWLISSPIFNSLLIILYLTIVLSGAVVFFIFINAYTFPTIEKKNRVLEINYQLLNGIFTLLMLFDMKFRVVGLVDGCRACCGSFKLTTKYEWADIPVHFLLAFISLNVSSVAQTCLSIVMWSYNYYNRPPVAIAVCLPVSFLSMAAGMTYIGIRQSKVKKTSQDSYAADNRDTNEMSEA